MAKSLLGIPREYQGRSYEGCIDHITLVCIRYQWLATEARTAEDVRTLGDLFFVQCQELEDLTLGWVIDQILAAFAAPCRGARAHGGPNRGVVPTLSGSGAQRPARADYADSVHRPIENGIGLDPQAIQNHVTLVKLN